MEKHYLSMLVENRAGVLSRISGLIARRGYNIESLSVCATEDDAYSRMTIEILGDERTIKQIRAQLSKQAEVVKLKELDASEAVLRELLLIKIGVQKSEIPEIVDLTQIYKAKTVDIADGAMTLELTGKAAKLDSFTEVLKPYGIIELARSGSSALDRGAVSLRDKE